MSQSVIERLSDLQADLADEQTRALVCPAGPWAGPYPLWVRLTCGLAVDSLHSPCAPLLPVWGVDRARHTVPPPPGRLALPSPPHRHPLHARASGSAAAACRGPPDHRLAAPFPPRCLQRKYARRAARHHRQLGGWENLQCGLTRATVSAGLPVDLAGVDLVRLGVPETSPARCWLRCRRRRSRCRR